MNRAEPDHGAIFAAMLANNPQLQTNPLQAMMDYVFSVHHPQESAEEAEKADRLREQLRPIAQQYPGYLGKRLS